MKPILVIRYGRKFFMSINAIITKTVTFFEDSERCVLSEHTGQELVT